MKNIKARRNGIVAAGSNGTVANRMNSAAKFRYTLEFSLYRENFVCSEILCFAVLCLNDSILVFLLSTLIVILLFHIVL